MRVAIPRVPLEITVPRVTGQKLEQARGTLEAAGLGLTVGGEETSLQPAGTVIRQTPETGTRVARNTSVSVVVSLSPDATPAPSTSASVALSQPGAEASRLSMKPSTSVLVEHSSPPSYQNVLAAPTALRARPASTAPAPAPCAEW